jgi:hypothetical protein
VRVDSISPDFGTTDGGTRAIVYSAQYDTARHPRERGGDMVIEGEYEVVPPNGQNMTEGSQRAPRLDSSGDVVPKRD